MRRQERLNTGGTALAAVIILSMILSTAASAASSMPVGGWSDAIVTPRMAQTTSGPQHQGGANVVYWQFQGTGDDFWEDDQIIWPDQKAPYTFWAQALRFTGSNDPGYLGLQTNGNRFDGSVGDLALFSIWNANAARGPSCHAFTGGGSGYSCRVPYTLATGIQYRLRLWRLETDSGGQWWGAWVRASDSGVDTHIGAIRVPTLPVRGACSTLWARQASGVVHLSARWSGDRQASARTARLTVIVQPPVSLSSLTWRGMRIGHLTHLASPIAADRLPDAHVIGLASAFTTTSPAYRCLNGRTLSVFAAPRSLPGVNVAYSPARAGCQAGRWLFAQGGAVSATCPILAASDALFSVPGSFPVVQPVATTVRILGVGARQSRASVVAWGTGAISVLVPGHLTPGTYAVALSWYDRLTGATVHVSGMPLRIHVNNHVLPVVVAPATHVLTYGTLSGLASLLGGREAAATRGPLTLTFTHPTSQIRALKPGDVLTAGISPTTPCGNCGHDLCVRAEGESRGGCRGSGRHRDQHRL